MKPDARVAMRSVAESGRASAARSVLRRRARDEASSRSNRHAQPPAGATVCSSISCCHSRSVDPGTEHIAQGAVGRHRHRDCSGVIVAAVAADRLETIARRRRRAAGTAQRWAIESSRGAAACRVSVAPGAPPVSNSTLPSRSARKTLAQLRAQQSARRQSRARIAPTSPLCSESTRDRMVSASIDEPSSRSTPRATAVALCRSVPRDRACWSFTSLKI